MGNFIATYLDKLTLVVLLVIPVNFVLGLAKSVGSGFNWGIALRGFFETIKKLIGVSALLVGYYVLKDVDMLAIAYSPIAFFIVGLSTVYHLNSCLVNSADLIGLKDVAVLSALDMKFKELLGKLPWTEEPTVETSAELEHLMNEEV